MAGMRGTGMDMDQTRSTPPTNVSNNGRNSEETNETTQGRNLSHFSRRTINQQQNHFQSQVQDSQDFGGQINAINRKKNANSKAKLNRNNVLLKDSVEDSDDESTNGEIRPNKLFPVKNERDVLLRKVRSVLNKVSSVNYHRLRKRWLSLMPSSEEDRDQCKSERLELHQIGEVLQLVIAKALDDTIYMHIYAGLMGYVVARKPVEISLKIRQLINAQLHHELQRLTTDKELALFHRSTERVDATRRKKVTLHRFIAELYGEKACTSRFLYERVTDLLIVNNPVDIDENVECLCVLMTFAGQKLEEAKKSWVEDIFLKLTQRQTEQPQIVSKRIQFMILDLVEMRSRNWSPHNKWWSPSVQRAPERERTQSSPSTPTPSSSSPSSVPVPNGIVPQLIRNSRNEQKNSTKPEAKEDPPVNSVNSVNRKVQRRNQGNNSRSRTRSEGSGSGNSNVNPQPLRILNLDSHQNQRQKLSPQNSLTSTSTSPTPRRNNSELSPNQSRALMALLNKVSPHNVDRIAHQLYEVLTQDTFDSAVNFIVDKILDDSFYTRTHASLIYKVTAKPNMNNFGVKVGHRVMRILEKNPESKDGFQLLAELYNLSLVTMHQVKTALEWLMNCSTFTGMINSAMESLVIFLFISGAKLESDLKDDKWITRLLDFWEKKANLVANNMGQGRPLCLLRDVIELRQNKWAPLRQPHWIPPTIDLPTIRFEPESLIRLFQSDRMEFLRFVKGETSTLTRIERFSKEALEYGVRHGNCERDPEFLKMTGICLRVLIQERLLRRGRLENFLGTFVTEVVAMSRVNKKAWDNWGLIMKEVF